MHKKLQYISFWSCSPIQKYCQREDKSMQIAMYSEGKLYDLKEYFLMNKFRDTFCKNLPKNFTFNNVTKATFDVEIFINIKCIQGPTTVSWQR